MTSQRLIEEFASWLWKRDEHYPGHDQNLRVPDSYVNEAAVFLAGPLGQRLQRSHSATSVSVPREDFSEYLEDSDG